LDRANKLYREALAQKPDDGVTLRNVAVFLAATGHRDEAEPLLRRMLALTGKQAGEAAWARRTLAVMLSGDGRERSQEALALVGLVGDSGPPDVKTPLEDQRAQAIVLSVRKDARQRRQAVAILEGLATRQAASPDDLFLLVQLYERLGDQTRGRATMARLLDVDPDGPAYLRHHIQQVLAEGSAAEADPWIARLEKLQPGDWTVVEFKAQSLAAKDRVDEAVELVDKVVGKKPAMAGLAASLLEKIHKPDKAGELYRQFVATSKRPESVLVLAGFLGRRQRVDEALDLCDRAWERGCDPAAVALHSVGVLQAPGVTDAQMSRVARRLEAAVRAHPDKPVLARHLADLRVLQGRHDEAEALYRDVVAKDRTDLTALNNLAWLLNRNAQTRDEALRLLDRAIEEAGEEPQLLDTRAVVYLALDDAEKARADLQKAVQDAATPSMYFHLAQAHWKQRERRDAAAALRHAKLLGLTATQLGPEEGRTYSQLASELGLN
jgi:Tfp pilus assembly protein PilF